MKPFARRRLMQRGMASVQNMSFAVEDRRLSRQEISRREASCRQPPRRQKESTSPRHGFDARPTDCTHRDEAPFVASAKGLTSSSPLVSYRWGRLYYYCY